MFYGEVFEALNKKRVRYVVAGGVAVVLHGFVRFTADLDLIIHLEEKNIESLFDILGALGYRPRVPVTKEEFKDNKRRDALVENKGMLVLSFFHPKEHLKNVDIFVKEPFRFDVIVKKAKRVKVGGITVPVLSLNHLIRLKRKSARPQDIIDVTNLMEIQRLEEA